jgi:hypothetical protein
MQAAIMRCRKCQLERPLERFPIRSDTGKRSLTCQDCRNIQSQEWVARNLMKRRASALKWAKAHYPYIRKKKAEYRARDPLRVRKWAIEHPERMQACRAAWDRRNPHRKLQHARNRQARKRQAIPKWANQEAMNAIYLQARTMGKEYEVDHIVPLKGKIVSGLHCEQNLQILRLRDNRQKGCFRWPDMP